MLTRFIKIERLQNEQATTIWGMVDKLDSQGDKIDMLMGIVAQQDIQIQGLTSKWDSTYVRDNKYNILISHMAKIQGQNCFHEAANLLKNILRIKKPITLMQQNWNGKI